MTVMGKKRILYLKVCHTQFSRIGSNPGWWMPVCSGAWPGLAWWSASWDQQDVSGHKDPQLGQILTSSLTAVPLGIE